MKRISVSLPDEVTENLNTVSKRMGFSRSALVAQLLEGPVAQIMGLVGGLDLEPTEGDKRRYAGDSIQVLRDAVKDIQAQIDDLEGKNS